MTLTAAILGLTRIGASIGLALGEYADILTCVGYDQEPAIARTAQKMGAVTKAYLASHRCVREARVVILACPLDEVRENLTIIAEHAPEGTVVIDTSPVKGAVADWAGELLPETHYFTGWTLALNPEHLHAVGLGVEAARADLFANSLIGINDPPGTPEAVLTLSSDLVALLDAKPFFIDAVEADGLIAMGHQLPRLAALALLQATADSSGWHEARKLAGPDYALGTQPVMHVGEREKLGQGLLLNAENLVRLLDDLIRSLMVLREGIAEGDADGLQKALEAAIDRRLLWLAQREKMVWTGDGRFQDPSVERPSLLGGWLGSRLKSNTDSSGGGS
jgi:prephenate dehydrogenase